MVDVGLRACAIFALAGLCSQVNLKLESGWRNAAYLAASLAVLEVDFRACATSACAACALTEAFSLPEPYMSTNQLVP